MNKTTTFFTIGHSTRSIPKFVDLLHESRVDLIVDVRSIPRSRTNPQFNADALPAALAEWQIGYVHLAELGGLRGGKCVQALGIPPGAAHSYGKGAIVGEAGELEHAAAILHPKLGAPLRAAVEKGAALVPSSKKRGGMGTSIDVPLGHKDAAFVRSHFDAMEVRVPDAPRANEIVVAVVVTDSGRPLPRVGGLQVHEIKGEDGLR